MTYFTQDAKKPKTQITTNKMIMTAAIISLGCAGVLTFSSSASFSVIQKTDSTQITPTTSHPQSEITATQFASFFGITAASGKMIDLMFIEAVIADRNAQSNAALLQSLADLLSIIPPNMDTQLSLSVSKTVLRQRGIENPWLSAPLRNAETSQITASDFTRSLMHVPQFEIAQLLQKFGEMRTVHLTHYFDTTVLSKAEYHVAMAILHERGAI